MQETIKMKKSKYPNNGYGDKFKKITRAQAIEIVGEKALTKLESDYLLEIKKWENRENYRHLVNGTFNAHKVFVENENKETKKQYRHMLSLDGVLNSSLKIDFAGYFVNTDNIYRDEEEFYRNKGI
jgi:hypothetical protein